MRRVTETSHNDLPAFGADGVVSIVDKSVANVHEVQSAVHSDVPAMQEGFNRRQRYVAHLVIRLEPAEVDRQVGRLFAGPFAECGDLLVGIVDPGDDQIVQFRVDAPWPVSCG